LTFPEFHSKNLINLHTTHPTPFPRSLPAKEQSALPVAPKRREPHEAAVAILKKYGGLIWLELPQFSPKWLTYYRPFWLVQKMVRSNPLARLLEELGLLPKLYRKIAHFDADGIVLTAFGYHELLRQAGREISAAMGVEIKVVKHEAPRQAARVAA
jgi:hypothetical protein